MTLPTIPYTLLQATGGGLNTATGYLLGNVTNYTASLSITSTSVSVTPTGSGAALGTAYWYGGQVTGAPAAMALSIPSTMPI